MNTENAKSRRKWRPNLFDIAIVVLIAAVGAVLYLMLRPSAANVTVVTTPMRYQVEMLNVPAGTHKLIQAGDAIVDGSKNASMGTVVDVAVQPYTVEIVDKAANVVRQAEVEGYETIVLTLEAPMVQTDSTITTEGGYLVRVGLPARTKGDNFAATGYIVGIER